MAEPVFIISVLAFFQQQEHYISRLFYYLGNLADAK